MISPFISTSSELHRYYLREKLPRSTYSPVANASRNKLHTGKKYLRATQLSLRLVAACASRNAVAHSSQHTSTALPPTFTWIASPSILQSQAAHVVSLMMLLLDLAESSPQSGVRAVERSSARRRCRNV
jgi:hypothetical protein